MRSIIQDGSDERPPTKEGAIHFKEDNNEGYSGRNI